MPIEVPVLTAEDENGLDFTNVLRGCLGCAVVAINAQRKVTGFNRQAEALTHLKASQAIGNSMEILPASLQKIINETFSTGKPIQDRQINLHDGNPGDLAIQINSTPIGTENGKPAGVVLVVNDVSLVIKWESNMRRLDRLHSVGTLSASMAHEVKNAFVAVRTFVDLLLEKNQQADLADIVRLEMGRIDSILGQMRKFSGPAKPEFSSVRLHLLLEKSLQLIQHLLADKKIKVTRAFAASPDSVQGDHDQLEQALINLFFNALDAMKPNGVLTVSTQIIPAGSAIAGLPQHKGPYVRVLIQDNGTGIPPENMDRLFEPFFTTKPDGTGLGLAITRRIIQEHHGVIAVESELNKGTTLSFTLPAGGNEA